MFRLAIALFAIILVFCPSRPAAAQQYGVNTTAPTVSTYLNLLYTSAAGVNLGFQNLKQPLDNANAMGLNNSANLGRLQSQVNGLQGGVRGGRRVSGASQYFMNYSHYYPNLR